MLHWADTRYGVPALFVLAFVESSFFPIPPDVLLIALCMGAPKKSFKFEGWCALASVLGVRLDYLHGGEIGPAFGAARLAQIAATRAVPAAVCTRLLEYVAQMEGDGGCRDAEGGRNGRRFVSTGEKQRNPGLGRGQVA